MARLVPYRSKTWIFCLRSCLSLSNEYLTGNSIFTAYLRKVLVPPLTDVGSGEILVPGYCLLTGTERT
jgi:hypothetical protein